MGKMGTGRRDYLTVWCALFTGDTCMGHGLGYRDTWYDTKREREGKGRKGGGGVGCPLTTPGSQEQRGEAILSPRGGVLQH